MPTTFFVAVNNDTGEYLADINSNGLPVFDPDINHAEWSPYQRVVEDYITAHNIQNVKTQSEGGNHPPKPPISA